MELDPILMPKSEIYKILTGAVVPRPIAWVSTLSALGVVNAAPFSAFAIVSVLPPMILVSCAREYGEKKHTADNIEKSGCFVVNIVNEMLLVPMHKSSARFPDGVSETETLDIRVEPSSQVRSWRITDSPISLECRLHQIFELGVEQTQSFIGEIVRFHVADSIMVDGKIDQRLLGPIGRIGGPNYVKMGETVRLEGAKYPANSAP